MKLKSILTSVLCATIVASSLVVAAAKSGSAAVGGGQWAWETYVGTYAKSSYYHRKNFHRASAQVGTGAIQVTTANAGETAQATAWGFLGTTRVWWDNE